MLKGKYKVLKLMNKQLKKASINGQKTEENV